MADAKLFPWQAGLKQAALKLVCQQTFELVYFFSTAILKVIA